MKTLNLKNKWISRILFGLVSLTMITSFAADNGRDGGGEILPPGQVSDRFDIEAALYERDLRWAAKFVIYDLQGKYSDYFDEVYDVEKKRKKKASEPGFVFDAKADRDAFGYAADQVTTLNILFGSPAQSGVGLRDLLKLIDEVEIVIEKEKGCFYPGNAEEQDASAIVSARRICFSIPKLVGRQIPKSELEARVVSVFIHELAHLRSAVTQLPELGQGQARHEKEEEICDFLQEHVAKNILEGQGPISFYDNLHSSLQILKAEIWGKMAMLKEARKDLSSATTFAEKCDALRPLTAQYVFSTKNIHVFFDGYTTFANATNVLPTSYENISRYDVFRFVVGNMNTACVKKFNASTILPSREAFGQAPSKSVYALMVATSPRLAEFVELYSPLLTDEEMRDSKKAVEENFRDGRVINPDPVPEAQQVFETTQIENISYGDFVAVERALSQAETLLTDFYNSILVMR